MLSVYKTMPIPDDVRVV